MASFRIMGVGGLKLKDINPNKSTQLSKGWDIRLGGSSYYAIPIQGYRNIYVAFYSAASNYQYCFLMWMEILLEQRKLLP